MSARLVLLMLALAAPAARAFPDVGAFDKPPHDYWERAPRDRFARAMERVALGESALDPSDERRMLASLLRVLDISDSSQLLVYSATSIQSALINPRNPRALYFNEDTSVGFVPGGRFEIASLDPEAGMVFYIFDRLAPGTAPRFVRSDRCMNCHADTPSGRVPGLVIDSVAVTWDGSSQETYRYDETGHHVPLAKRFGGWHLTGGHGLTSTHANLIGDLSPKGLLTEPNPPGKNFDLRRYPRPTSDILPHLVHEHQAGFLNRVVQAVYLARLKTPPAPALDALVDDLAGYLLFQGEAALPAGGIRGDPDFMRDFIARAQGPAAELRAFDLTNRIFRHRLSYLVATSVWDAMPAQVSARVGQRVVARLSSPSHETSPEDLTPGEKQAILPLLRAVRPEWFQGTGAQANPQESSPTP